jgi:AcrR family transcriptional regulator
MCNVIKYHHKHSLKIDLKYHLKREDMMKKVYTETENAIIKATKEILGEKGNATIKEISKRAYVNIAAINYHFGSKDELISIIIEDVIGDLQNEIIVELLENDIHLEDFEESMNKLFNIMFSFAERNAGIINYSFLQMATQSKATNILVELFIIDEDFIEMIMSLLRRTLPEANDETLFSKYIILFSSFVVPFFLSFSGWHGLFEDDKENENFLKNHRETYLREIKKVLFT